MKVLNVFLFCQLILVSAVNSQSLQKQSFSAFSNAAVNDSVYCVAGQLMSGDNAAPLVYHGYLPFQYSTLKLQENLNGKCDVFPNPFNESVTVRFNDNLERKIEIFSLGGELQSFRHFSGSEMELILSDVVSGIYFLRITEPNGSVYSMKIIKN